jgi:threonine dehydrogenase-like Zn-dependent dehydrogenase
MKALVLEAYNRLIYQEVPDAAPAADEVLIQVMACGICGSDVHGMDGSTGRRIPPLIMGHEASGIITKIGKQVRGWQPGDRVTFDSTIYQLDDWYSRKGMYNLSENRMVLGVSPGEYNRPGAFAEYVAVPAHILYHIPSEVSYNQAALVEPAAVAAHAVRLTPVEINDAAVVVGAGMIGLFLVQLLRLAGCGTIIAIDLVQGKLELAKKFGAELCLRADDRSVTAKIMEVTQQRGADIAFDAVGVSDSVRTAISTIRKGGTLTLIGNLQPKIDLALQEVVTRQLRLQGSCAIAGEYPRVLDLIARGRIDVNEILSTVAPLSQGAQWFDKLYKREPGLLKVLLVPDSVLGENHA